MITKLVLLTIATVILTGCKPPDEQALTVSLFEENRHAFEEIVEVIKKYPALQNVTPGYDPVNRSQFISKYREFDAEDITAYLKVVDLMGGGHIQVINIYRDQTRLELPLIDIGFLMFGRGIAGDTEGTLILYWNGTTPMEKPINVFHTCSSVDEPHWYLCWYS